MQFSLGSIYHIYNQGNNRQKIFFTIENYEFFIRKVRIHLLPYADILAWCLMPNHFHIMVEVKEVVLPAPAPAHGVAALHSPVSRSATASRAPTKPGAPTKPPPANDEIDLNHSIGIMLASYTRAINKQENTTGSLFRQKTKAICLNEQQGVSSNWYMEYGVTFLKLSIPEWQYPQVCFNYIHNNPVKAGLVADARHWRYSSLNEIINKSPDSLVNLD